MGGAPFSPALFYVTVSGEMRNVRRDRTFVENDQKAAAGEQKCTKNNKVWQPTAENNKISVNKNNKNKDQGQDYNRNVARRKAKYTVSCTMGKGKELKCAQYDADRSIARRCATVGCDTF